MEYSGGGTQHLDYGHALSQQLGQLNLDGQGGATYGAPGLQGHGGGCPSPAAFPKPFSTTTFPNASSPRLQEPLLQDQVPYGSSLGPSNPNLLGGMGSAGAVSPRLTPIQSQRSSPIRSSLGGAQLGSSSLSVGMQKEPLRSEGYVGQFPSSVSPVHAQQLSREQLASSLPTSFGQLPLERHVPQTLRSQETLQSRLSGAQLGTSWGGGIESQSANFQVPLQSSTLDQSGALGYSSLGVYNSQAVNGQMASGMHLPGSMPYQSQLQLEGMGFMPMQPQQMQYGNFSQLQQVFPQEQNGFQYNVDYTDSSNSNMYQDYYYDYQYNGYEGSAENLLDPNYLGTPVARSTTPYGDETVEELGPEEVRWFYKIEADKKWTPFIGYDSLRIEWKYRDLMQDTNPTGADTSPYSNPESDKQSPREQEEKSQVVERIVVRGGLYEVDVKHRKCESIYWKGEVFMISRGTWFYEGAWGPVEEMLADRIEMEHLAHFRGHLLSTQRIDDTTKQIVHSLSLPEGHVDWFSALEVYLSSDATPSRLMRSVGKKLGFQKTGYKLHRGYSIDATASDKPPDISHIVFVIHGIGQKMETGRIIKNCTALRENVQHLKQKYFPSVANCGQTVEFFPVEWRSSLVLDAGVIESITPHKILNIRQMLNASFMDIMYYNSPLYREEVINGLTGEMNRLYTMFTQRNPYFEANGGKVSIIAHSLGCVITYDIVIGWNPAQQFDQQLMQSLMSLIEKKDEMKWDDQIKLKKDLQDLLREHQSNPLQPSLNFKIENFFCLGSPLAVFLALRTKQTQSKQSDVIPQKLCKRLLNIFHPADPVAYRIEPLLCPQYSTIAPVVIHSYNAGEKVPYNEMPLEPIIVPKEKDKDKDPLERSDSGSNTPVSSVPSTPSKGGASTWSWWGLMKGSKKSDSGTGNPDNNLSLQDVRGLSDRIDFVLREGSMESSYISAVTSHTSYWTNYDVSHFLLNILYPEIQPTSSKPEVIKP